IFFSKALVLGPVVIQPVLSVSTTSSISFSVISGGENGIFISFISFQVNNYNLQSVISLGNLALSNLLFTSTTIPLSCLSKSSKWLHPLLTYASCGTA